MATYMCSRHELKVRFLSPAPIFVILVLFCFCGSAGAVDISPDDVYSFGDFDYFGSQYSQVIINGVNNVNNPFSSTSGTLYAALPANSSVSSGSVGNLYSSSIDKTKFDSISPQFRFLKLGIFYPYSESGSSVFSYTGQSLYLILGEAGSSYASGFTFTYNLSSGVVSAPSGSYLSSYATEVITRSEGVSVNYYVALSRNTVLYGFGVQVVKNSSVIPSIWSVPLDNFTFSASSSKIVPESSSSGGSSGSVDLSSITSQINSLSSQMSASFNEVNANIDSAESSISNIIDNQTTALEGAISDAAGDITTNFNNWDNQLSDAFSSDDGQAVVDANAAVSGVHQVEDDAIENAGNQLSDAGLDSYDLPAAYKSSLSNMSYLLSLLFQSCSWITDLITFSCIFGIAFVLIGRKSRGSE